MIRIKLRVFCLFFSFLFVSNAFGANMEELKGKFSEYLIEESWGAAEGVLMKIKPVDISEYLYLKSLLYGLESYPDYSTDKAFESIKMASGHGHMTAKLSLAFVYANSEDWSKKNISEAISLLKEVTPWLIKEEKSGNVEASLNLGMLYFIGLGVEKNYSKSLGFFQNAYDKGSEQAADYLASMYWNGYGVKVDRKRAGDFKKIEKKGAD